jgi:LmbE family N-acetylglucosaminyl deacetylase
MKTIVIAPHPDDEVLGAGGTLLRRAAEGGAVAWLIVTGISEVSGWPREKVEKRAAEIEKVAKMFGFSEVFVLGYPTTQLDQVPTGQLISSISAVFKRFAPEEVLLAHRGDVHSDHRITFDAVSACVKWFRYPSVKRVMAYETASETEFNLSQETRFSPNVFVDIGTHLDAKLEILKVYESELGDHPFPRSVKAVRALAEWRGANSGCSAAEAFELLLGRE